MDPHHNNDLEGMFPEMPDTLSDIDLFAFNAFPPAIPEVGAAQAMEPDILGVEPPNTFSVCIFL